MEINELSVQIRTGAGKGHSRRFREKGLVPAVFYGPGTETRLLTVSAADLASLRKKEENVFIKLIIDDHGKKLEKLSILKDYQLEPLSRRYIHVDFYEISMDHKLTFDVPLHFSGKPLGVTEGGELHLLKRDLKISCLPALRPEFITADVSGLQIGDSLKVQNLIPIEGVEMLDHADTVIAAVASVKAAERAEEETETVETPA